MTDPQRFEVPADRFYDRQSHLWAQERSGQETAITVGIDRFGLDSLGELAFIALVPVGTRVAKGEALGSLEAAKMTAAISSPVCGRVVARNEAVLAQPAAVNKDPYQSGWLVEIEPEDWASNHQQLVAPADVALWAREEEARFAQDESSAG